MHAGFFAALFLSSLFFLFAQAAPSSVQQRDLIGNVEEAADQLFSINIGSILSEATPVVESVFNEATAAIGSVIANDPALAAKATSILGDAESFLGPAATQISKDVDVVSNGAAAMSDIAITRPLAAGAAAVLGSMLLGLFAVL